MNGGVNGTMEESTELSLSDSLQKSSTDETSKEYYCSLNKLNNINSESNNHIDSASEPIEKCDNIAQVAITTGTMEESTELPLSDFLQKSTTDETSKEDDCSLNKLININSKSDNHIDSVSEPIEKSDKMAQVAISNGIVDHTTDEFTNNTPMVQQQDTNNATDTHCSTIEYISNELCLNSLDSNENLETKQEVPDKSDHSSICSDDMSKLNETIDSEVMINAESDITFSKNEVDSEELVQQKAEEKVNIKTKTDNDAGSSQENTNKNRAPLKEWPDGHDPNSIECSSPDVQVIVSDSENCVIDLEDEPTPIKQDKSQLCVIDLEDEPSPIKEDKPPLRRSSRAIKRKRYDMENGDDESDVEVAAMHHVKRRPKPVGIRNTKTLVEIALAKQMRSATFKKENSVDFNREILNRGPMMRKNPMALSNTSLSAQNFYQSILARGTTVTPVNNKCPPQTQSSTNAQPNVLPSLTEDMFVVEAPSFIVPYVYEKPSVKPFREFVDKLAKDIAAMKAKEDELKKEEEEAIKESPDIEIKDINETSRQAECENADDESGKKIETEENDKEDSKKKKNLKRKRLRGPDDDDDASWDESFSSSSDDDICSDEEDSVVIKAKEALNNKLKDITSENLGIGKSNSYFDMPLGKFFMDIGLNFVQEYVQNDLLKQQNRKLYREKKGGHSTKITATSIASLMKNIEMSKEANAPYRFEQRKCEFCSFKSESLLAGSHHLETPHMKNGVYICNFCKYESKSPHEILHHIETEHNTRGRLERAPSCHQCANCPFEDNGKGKLARHLIACAKKFKPEFNLSPPVDWEPPAKIPKMAQSRNPNMLGSYHSMFNKGPTNFARPVMNNFGSSSGYSPRRRSPLSGPTRLPIHGIPIVNSGIIRNASTRAHTPSNFSGNNDKNGPGIKSFHHQPSISITSLPKQPQPRQLALPAAQSQQNKSSCVICEICDGYIKDLEQLRNHMQWIHKVKIHPKMIYNRPPLNCQKCQFRFFTDQGLERHLLGSHGLVTSSMQEAANKGKDAGRCPVCGRVYQWKLLNHVTRDHKLALKPAHLSYKCTVCTATFGMYKQFESHVYSAHSVVAKRVLDKGKTPAVPNKVPDKETVEDSVMEPVDDSVKEVVKVPVKTQVKALPKVGQSLLKPIQINDEITITPQLAKDADKK